MSAANFRNKTRHLKASSFLDYRQFLESIYEALKADDAEYTFHKFGGDLGLSESNVVNHIIRGRRPLTVEAAGKVCKALNLTGVEKKYFMLLVEFQHEKDPTSRDQAFHALYELKKELLGDKGQQEKLTYFSKWYYPAIGELARTIGFQCSAKWIVKKFWAKISMKDAESAIEFLKEVRILELDETDGVVKRTALDFSTGHATKDLSISSYHRQVLALADQALSNIDKDQRNFSATTVVLSDANMKALNNLIYEFQRKVMELEVSEQERQNVCQVNLQMFPLSK